jgi:hypothetical protein
MMQESSASGGFARCRSPYGAISTRVAGHRSEILVSIAIGQSVEHEQDGKSAAPRRRRIATVQGVRV